MKKFFALALTLVMALSLTACGNKENTPAEDETPDAQNEEKAPGWWKEELKTVTEGKLTVATSPDFAPYEFYAIDENGNANLAGFDLALADYIANYMGLELEVVPMAFNGVLSELTAGNVDLGVAGLSPDPEREGAMDFSDIYYKGSQSMVVNVANKDKWASIEDLNNPEVSVGAQLGSIQHDLAKENTPDADIIPLSKVTDIVSELLGGKLDAGVIETVVAESYAKNYPDLHILCEVPYNVAGSSVGVQKGNEALMAGVNEAIAAALEDGSMDQFIADANLLAEGETAILQDGEIVAG